MSGDKPAKQKFRVCLIGYVHIDIAEYGPERLKRFSTSLQRPVFLRMQDTELRASRVKPWAPAFAGERTVSDHLLASIELKSFTLDGVQRLLRSVQAVEEKGRGGRKINFLGCRVALQQP